MKLANFLKKYSVINDEFIDDYHTFFDEKADELFWTINLYDIAKWLDIKEEKLKELLTNNFIKEIDYIIDKKNTNNLILSPKCCKLLCMMSESKKANLIRTYHIDLEKLIVKYKEEIVNDLDKQMNIKKNSNKELFENDPQEDDKGLIYILKVRDGIYKLKYISEKKNKTKKYKLPIVFIFKIENYIEAHIDEIKKNLNKYIYKNKTRTYKIDLELLKGKIKYSCDIMS
jgi:phage anti-repressor protein